MVQATTHIGPYLYTLRDGPVQYVPHPIPARADESPATDYMPHAAPYRRPDGVIQHVFRTAGPQVVERPAERPVRVKSDAELWQALAEAIGDTQAGTVDVYHQMLSKYTAFFKDVTEFKSRLADYVSAGSDQNHIGVDVGKINYELQALLEKWQGTAVFGPATLKEAQRWSDEWGLPISNTGDGYSVVIDTSALDVMMTATGNVDKTYASYTTVAPDSVSQKVDWLGAEHNAWDTAMGEQHRQIETRVGALAELNNHALSTFNNLNKVLSASINAMAESLGSYARGF